MLKDIPQLRMEAFGVAMVPVHGTEPSKLPDWECFLLNMKDDPVLDVLITAEGYGDLEGEQRQSTTLRYYYGEIDPQAAVMLELVPANLSGLTNSYWISFKYHGHMYDKKFTFVPDSLNKVFLTQVPIVNKKGILIR